MTSPSARATPGPLEAVGHIVRTPRTEGGTIFAECFKDGSPSSGRAARIVLCVNSHDDLLAALKAVVAVADRDTPEFRAARAALSKAQGEAK